VGQCTFAGACTVGSKDAGNTNKCTRMRNPSCLSEACREPPIIAGVSVALTNHMGRKAQSEVMKLAMPVREGGAPERPRQVVKYSR